MPMKLSQSLSCVTVIFAWGLGSIDAWLQVKSSLMLRLPCFSSPSASRTEQLLPPEYSSETPATGSRGSYNSHSAFPGLWMSPESAEQLLESLNNWYAPAGPIFMHSFERIQLGSTCTRHKLARRPLNSHDQATQRANLLFGCSQHHAQQCLELVLLSYRKLRCHRYRSVHDDMHRSGTLTFVQTATLK